MVIRTTGVTTTLGVNQQDLEDRPGSKSRDIVSLPMSRRDIFGLVLAIERVDGQPTPQSLDADRHIVDLSRELRAAKEAIDALLDRDRRDTEDIPGFVCLADRRIRLAQALGAERACGLRGLLAKALAVDEGDVRIGAEAATAICLSIVQDVIAVLGCVAT